MAKITIEADEKSLKRLKSALEKYPKAAETAMIRLMNEAVTKGSGELLKLIPQKYNIKKSDLQGGSRYKSEQSNNLVKAKKISSLHQQAKVEVRGGLLTLQRFITNTRKPSHITREILKVKVKKGKAKSLGKYAFLQNDESGNLQVFQRRSNSRKISRLMKTTSVAFMASNEEIAPKVQEAINDKLEKRVEHYIDMELKKIKG